MKRWIEKDTAMVDSGETLEDKAGNEEMMERLTAMADG